MSWVPLLVACTSATPGPSPTPAPAAATPSSTAAPATAPPTDAPAAPGLLDSYRAAKIETAKNQGKALHAAVQLYLVSKSDCPKDVQALFAERMIPNVPMDPWDASFEIQCTKAGESVLVVSRGPDGERGTPDDIVIESDEL